MCLNRLFNHSERFKADDLRAILGLLLKEVAMTDDTIGHNEADQTPEPPRLELDPPAWISTDWLDTELFNAIMEDPANAGDEENFVEEIGDSRDESGYEDETGQRRSQLRLLATMRPQLAELIGGPPVFSQLLGAANSHRIRCDRAQGENTGVRVDCDA
jgi:hypothetical protein